MSTKAISNQKLKIVENMKKELQAYPIIGLVKIDNINARVVQKMRADIRKEAKIVMAKNTLMRRAVEELQGKVPGIEKLLEHITGPCAFLLTHRNPFKLATYMDNNKVPAPAKAGQIASNDVIIPAMNTGIPPGPVIAELQSIGLKTRIEGGQIRISEPAVVTKEGERVNRSVTVLLKRLGIEPFKTGLAFTVAFENDQIIDGKELIIDYDAFKQQLEWAYASAMNLAVNACVINKRSLPLILPTAYKQAINLSVNSGIANRRSIPFLMSKAVSEAFAIAQELSKVNAQAVSPKIVERLEQRAA